MLRLLHRTATPSEVAAVHEHLAGCATCRRFVAEASEVLFEDAPPPAADTESFAIIQRADAPPRPPLAAGAQVSRYVIRRLIGAGAGGAVYEAHDPHLGRLVALKLIRKTARHSLPRSEEQALGRLSHPNVVGVHDAGSFEGETFVVMELVEGMTLDQWLEERPRQLGEILDVFVDAARGLCAAHAVGLVHRDFKPQNVIVGMDGRARVADFGLARPIEAGGLGAESLAGTPAYMAPEQFLGRAADAQSDQFSFCVAFYRAVYGRHPFGAEGDDRTLRGFARSVIVGQLRPVPEDRDVPAWLERVIVRGLARQPEDRHASMSEVLAAIADGRAVPLAPDTAGTRPPRSWARPLAVVATTVLVVAGLVAWSARKPRPIVAPAAICGDGVVAGAEACDDGNRDDGDGCLASCRWAACGDGHLRRTVEECDDGNRSNSDGCTSSCLRCSGGDASIAVDGACYSRHDAPLPWEAAAAACRQQGAHLVTLRNRTEVRAVQQRLLAGRSGSYWIGLRDRSDREWLTAEPINPALSSGESAPLDDHCFVAAPAPVGSGDARPWTAVPCASALGYVCERAGWIVAPKTNHAYRLLGPERRFDEARAACQRVGAHLVTVTSLDENAFIGEQFFGVIWIGAVKRARDRPFAWVTAEPFGFQAFAVGDPDRTELPDCVVLAEGRKWHDRSCDGAEAGPYGTVCEMD